MTVEGYDVSSWNATTPNLRTTGRGFLFARKCYGSRQDALYPMHAGNVRTLYPSAVLGSYIFGRSSLIVPIASQVAAFLDKNTSDVLVLDLEHDASGFVGLAASGTEEMGPMPMQAGRDDLGLAASTVISMSNTDARRFIAAVHAKGRKIGLYHSASGFPDLGQDFDWVAQWRTAPPSIGWQFWQYTSTPIDKNRFNGDMAALYALAGRAPHVPVVHIAKGATIRVYTLSTTGCIKTLPDGSYGVDIPWNRDASQMSVYPGGQVKRRTCDGKSWAYTIRVKSALAAVNGRWIRVGANGVTYS